MFSNQWTYVLHSTQAGIRQGGAHSWQKKPVFTSVLYYMSIHCYSFTSVCCRRYFSLLICTGWCGKRRNIVLIRPHLYRVQTVQRVARPISPKPSQPPVWSSQSSPNISSISTAHLHTTVWFPIKGPTAPLGTWINMDFFYTKIFAVLVNLKTCLGHTCT